MGQLHFFFFLALTWEALRDRERDPLKKELDYFELTKMIHDFDNIAFLIAMKYTISGF